MKKVIFCVPSLVHPTKPFRDSLEASIPLIVAAGWEEGFTHIEGNPYISAARATMTRYALDAMNRPEIHPDDCVCYLDYDLSWNPKDLLTLINTEGDVVAGTYRCKVDEESYMGSHFSGADGRPIVRHLDGAVKADLIPAGFLKITVEGINKFMGAYPELCYGPYHHAAIDLFNHGAHERIWWGEDYSFARRWKEKCGDIWIVPNLNIDHHTKDKIYKGNYHNYLMGLPGSDQAMYEAFLKETHDKVAV